MGKNKELTVHITAILYMLKMRTAGGLLVMAKEQVI